MTGPALKISHAREAHFERGLRSFFEYRDLGIKEATQGAVAAHVIRAIPGESTPGSSHLHELQFQLVYVLKGWVELDYEDTGLVRLEAGTSVYQPPGIRHREVAHSDDLEMLEIVMPADFRTTNAISRSIGD
jgi:quercetin dioxygenase-like cupin family protein